LLEQIASEFGFAVHQLDAESPAGRRLAQVSGLRQLPGIYIDLELVAWGRPRPAALRKRLARYYAP
jgi:hypothetical protein